MGITRSYLRLTEEQIDALGALEEEPPLHEILKANQEAMDIDRSWEMLNYLITGEKEYSAHPFAKVIYPANHTIEISKEEAAVLDKHYEDGRAEATAEMQRIALKFELSQDYINPAEINAVVAHLAEFNMAERVAEVDFEALNALGIYPEIWNNSTDHQTYVLDHFNSLYAFLKRARDAKDFVVVQ